MGARGLVGAQPLLRRAETRDDHILFLVAAARDGGDLFVTVGGQRQLAALGGGHGTHQQRQRLFGVSRQYLTGQVIGLRQMAGAGRQDLQHPVGGQRRVGIARTFLQRAAIGVQRPLVVAARQQTVGLVQETRGPAIQPGELAAGVRSRLGLGRFSRPFEGDAIGRDLHRAQPGVGGVGQPPAVAREDLQQGQLQRIEIDPPARPGPRRDDAGHDRACHQRRGDGKKSIDAQVVDGDPQAAGPVASDPGAGGEGRLAPAHRGAANQAKGTLGDADPYVGDPGRREARPDP